MEIWEEGTWERELGRRNGRGDLEEVRDEGREGNKEGPGKKEGNWEGRRNWEEKKEERRKWGGQRAGMREGKSVWNREGARKAGREERGNLEEGTGKRE